MKKTLLYSVVAGSLIFASCSKDDSDDTNPGSGTEQPVDTTGGDSTEVPAELIIPETYVFLNDAGESTVSYSGQSSRLAQLGEIKGFMGADSDVTAQELKDMYANKGGNGGGKFSQEYAKDLKSKTDMEASETQAVVEGWFDDFEASDSTVTREGKNSDVKVSEKNGHELVQFVEKGLMGAVFFNQGVDNYLANLMEDDNEAVKEGKTYTVREHHFDEAFGYFGAPVNYPTEAGSYHAKYATSQGKDEVIMDAFKKGRAAIVAKDDEEMKAQVEIIRSEWENVLGLQAISYINSAASALAEGKVGDFVHPISEAYAFIWSLNFKSDAKISKAEIKSALEKIENIKDISDDDLTSVLDTLKSYYN